MIASVISSLVDFGQGLVVSSGYAGVFLVAVLENFFPPLPSELIFPFVGFVVGSPAPAGRGELGLAGVVLAGGLGALVGAWFWYGLGWALGRANLKLFLQRWGKFFRIHFSDVERAENWFSRFQAPVVFFGRLIPLVRTMISVPAGFVRMPFLSFSGLTLVGSLLWVGALTFGGFWLGENWRQMGPLVQDYQLVWELILAVGVLVFVFWNLRHRHRIKSKN